MDTKQTDYGTFPIGRDDIRGQQCCTIDLRRETGGWDWRDHVGADIQHEPGHPFALSVFAAHDGGVAVAEVLIIFKDQPVSLVGQATGRPGIIEITPDHLRGAVSDNEYRQVLLGYIGVGDAAPAA